ANFHPQSGSPAIDAGSNSAPNLPATDLDGNARIVDGNDDGTAVVDMGAYEFFPATDSVSPSSLAFGNQQVGSSSSAQTVTLTNTGGTTLLLAISVDTNFAETDNCGSAVAPSASCSVNVTFTPTTSGAINGNLTMRSNASGSPQSVSLIGTGTAVAVSLTPTSVPFGNQQVGTTSASQPLTLSNSSGSTVTISSIAVTGTNSAVFAQRNTCGSSLAAGPNCAINVTFNPTASGSRTAAVTVYGSASSRPPPVSLSGTAAGPT